MSTLRPVSLLERLRAKKGVPLMKAADMLHMSHKTLRKYERGNVPYPNSDVLRRFADFYDVDADEILMDLRSRALEGEPEREAA